MDETQPSPIPAFLKGGGRAAELIRKRDWSNHPLGPPERWPIELRTALSLVLNSPESMILAWGDDLWFFFNETYFPLLGPRIDWAMGERFDRVWADAWDQARPIIDDAFAGRPQRFVDLPWKLGTDRGPADTWFTFSYSRILNGDGRIAGLFILTNETTERVLADAALIESQAKLASALDDLRALNASLEQRVAERTAERDRLWQTSPDLLVIIDDDLRCERVNPAWTAVLGWEADELIGRSAVDLAHPDDLTATERALADSQAGTLPPFEHRCRHKDGSYRWISWVAAPSGAKIFATGRHITAQKEAEAALQLAEEQLRQAQKVEAVGQLTGGVAHDFNNLLTVIRGSAELLRRPELPDERRARYVEAISDAAGRATKLTSQLLAFARRQTLKPEIFDVRENLTGLHEMVRTLLGARIEVRMDIDDRSYLVDADRSQFDAAIVNLAVNARDAMGGAGTLTVSVATVDAIPALRGHVSRSGTFVAITMSDTGSGIAPDDMDRIFEPFFTTKGVGEGTGLGLSQIFGFAKQSGGDIQAQNSPDGGAHFTMFLPQAAISGEHRQAPPDGLGEIDLSALDLCILVVEDDHDVGQFAINALAEIGCNTLLARNAAEALDLLRDHGDQINIVLTDVVMPGMSGIELAQEVRRSFPTLPIVLASGYSTVLAETGVHGFELLRKPFTIRDLTLVLQTVAGTRGPAPGLVALIGD